jgi:hypothetical protein
MFHESAYGGLRPPLDLGMRNADFGMDLMQIIDIYAQESEIRNLKTFSQRQFMKHPG